MNQQRYLFIAAKIGSLALVASSAFAAPPVVEILAMPHPPVKLALQPLRDWLAQQGAKVVIKEINIESPEGVKRMHATGRSGHIPILILIDGKYSVTRKNGNAIEFVNFPNVPGSPPGARGDWTTTDVRSVITERIQ